MNKKQIVFYCATSPTVVFYKLGRILKKKGYKTIMFAMCGKDTIDYNFYKEAFDKVIYSDFQFIKPTKDRFFLLLRGVPSLFVFLVKMKFVHPDVVIGNLGGNWQIRLMHKYFFRRSPFIYFPYDIISHSFASRDDARKEGVKDFEIEAEKYCFENCEGIIHKGDPDELQIEGRLHKKINLPNLQLNFLPYCSKDFIISSQDKLSKKDGEIHIVSPGFLPNAPSLIKKFSYVLKSLAKQKIHMHLFITVNHIPKKEEQNYVKEFFRMLPQSKYLHIHDPLGPKELIKEISKYDFGFLNSYDRNKDTLDPVMGMGNKISSFFEAGLPVVYEDSLKFMGRLLDSYSLGISFNSNNIKTLKKRLEKLKRNDIKKRISYAQKDFDIEKNFPRLESFIEAVIAKKKGR